MIVTYGSNTNSTLEQIDNHLYGYINPILLRMKGDKNIDFTGAVLVVLNSNDELNMHLIWKIYSTMRSEENEVAYKHDKITYTNLLSI